MSQVHARFKLDEDTRVVQHKQNKETGGWEKVEAARVKMYPVTGEPFGSATPTGELMMVIVNPEALKLFRHAALGQEYDVVFTPVPKTE